MTQQDHRLLFPEERKHYFRKLLEVAASPYDDLEAFLLDVFPVISQVPREILAALFEFRNDPRSPGFLLLENFPLDEFVPPTPVNSKRSPLKETFVSEAIALGFAKILGEPMGFRDEKNGEIIQNISPMKLADHETTSVNPDMDLGFHVDLDFYPGNLDLPFNLCNADFLVLVCLHGDPAGKAITRYADARDLCRLLPEKDLAILRQARFQFGASYTFTGKTGAEKIWSTEVPIIKGPETFPEIGIDMFCGVRGVDPEACESLAEVGRICNREGVARAVNLRAGDVLLINNRKGAHARTAFPTFYDGTDRWLQRVYVRKSLWELRERVGASSLRVF